VVAPDGHSNRNLPRLLAGALDSCCARRGLLAAATLDLQMGPAEAGTPAEVSNRRPPAALDAFPSPASITSSLDSPSLTRSLPRAAWAWTPRSEPAAVPVPPAPGDVEVKQLATPPATDVSLSDLKMMVGGALAPVHITPPYQPHHKSGPGLRLPSFEALGIAAPHPDRYGHSSLDGAADQACDSLREPLGSSGRDAELLHAFEGLHADRDGASSKPVGDKTGGRAVASPVHHFISTLTPPAEGGEMDWRAMTTVVSAPIDSPSTDPGHGAVQASTPQTSPEPASSSAQAHSDSSASTPGAASWVDGAVHTLRTLHVSLGSTTTGWTC
jgi:hypothetical protein